MMVVVMEDPNSSDPVEVYAVLEPPHPTTPLPIDYDMARQWAMTDYMKWAREDDPSIPEQDPDDFCQKMEVDFYVRTIPVRSFAEWQQEIWK